MCGLQMTIGGLTRKARVRRQRTESMEREPHTHQYCGRNCWWIGGFEVREGQPSRKQEAVGVRKLSAPAKRSVLPPENALHCYPTPGIGMGCHLFPSRPHNGRFLRHRFSPKPTSVATQNSLPKRDHVAKEAVSTALQTKTRQRSDRTLQTKGCSSDEAVA